MTPHLSTYTSTTFQAGDLAAAYTAYGCGVVRILGPTTHPTHFPGYYRAVSDNGEEGLFDVAQLRPATDAEVAAYHRAHCRPAPMSTYEVAANSEVMAGRRVEWCDKEYRLCEPRVARLLQADHNQRYGEIATPLVWAFDNDGRVMGNTASAWRLL